MWWAWRDSGRITSVLLLLHTWTEAFYNDLFLVVTFIIDTVKAVALHITLTFKCFQDIGYSLFPTHYLRSVCANFTLRGHYGWSQHWLAKDDDATLHSKHSMGKRERVEVGLTGFHKTKVRGPKRGREKWVKCQGSKLRGFRDLDEMFLELFMI